MKVGILTFLMGGYLLIHDVFPNPNDGGRPPYEVFCEAKNQKILKKLNWLKAWQF